MLNPRVKGDAGLNAETYVPAVDTRAAAVAMRAMVAKSIKEYKEVGCEGNDAC